MAPTRPRWTASGFRRTNVRSRGTSRPLLRLLCGLRLDLRGLLLVAPPASLHPFRLFVEPTLEGVPPLRSLEERKELLDLDLLDVLPAVLLPVPRGNLDPERLGHRKPGEVCLRLGPRKVRAEAVVDEVDDVRRNRLPLGRLHVEERGPRLRFDPHA